MSASQLQRTCRIFNSLSLRGEPHFAGAVCLLSILIYNSLLWSENLGRICTPCKGKSFSGTPFLLFHASWASFVSWIWQKLQWEQTKNLPMKTISRFNFFVVMKKLSWSLVVGVFPLGISCRITWKGRLLELIMRNADTKLDMTFSVLFKESLPYLTSHRIKSSSGFYTIEMLI